MNAAGRPKYNPERRKTFAISDWIPVCRGAAAKLSAERLTELATWLDLAACNPSPTKSDQDRLDACICLIAALHPAKYGESLFVGNCATGYIVVPDSEVLRAELTIRCRELTANPSRVDPRFSFRCWE
jgi:predicted RNase H-like nuclease